MRTITQENITNVLKSQETPKVIKNTPKIFLDSQYAGSSYKASNVCLRRNIFTPALKKMRIENYSIE